MNCPTSALATILHGGPYGTIIAMTRATIAISDFEDHRLAPYRQLKERELAREGGRFIAEGEYIVTRLLASHLVTESVLLSERRADEIAPRVPEGVPVYVASDDVIQRLIGFRFHSGIIACGRRGPRRTLEDSVPKSGPCTLVICPEIANTENLGSLIRISSAFGVDAMILGQHCCDPFFRQSVRVSMGTVFRLPIIQSEDLERDLTRLRDDFQVELAATVLDSSAEPLARAGRPDRFALLFGNEAQGVAPRWVAMCRRRITIPMRLGTDSLNVAVAAGIFLYHFTQSPA